MTRTSHPPRQGDGKLSNLDAGLGYRGYVAGPFGRSRYVGMTPRT